MAKKVEKQPREYTKRQLSHAKKQALRQRIYLFGGIAVIVAVILLTLSGWIFGEYLPLNKTIGSIYDSKIKEKDLIDTAIVYAQTQTGVDITQSLDSVVNAMLQNTLIKQEAAKLGITVSDQELSDQLKGAKISNGYKELVRASMLADKMRKEYFSKQVPDSGNQVLMKAMMVESPELVPGIKDSLLNGDNFTALVNKYAVNKVSIDNGGVFDWHPASVLSSDISTSIPVDWAFNQNTIKGQISDALTDNASSKELGYWLIRINQAAGQTADGNISADVSALLLSSEAEATRIKAQLESGADLATLADKYSQYTPTQQAHGTITAVQSDNISDNFNNYVFNPGTPVGVWSGPIKDTKYSTKGGAWIVQVVDKDNNRPYSTDDKNTMVDSAYSDWTNNLWLTASPDVRLYFDDASRKLAIERINVKVK